jgi:hypothetical protein
MRDDLNQGELHRGLAIVAVALLVSMASGFTLIGSEVPVSEHGPQSFVGTTPEANPNPEPLPPQF